MLGFEESNEIIDEFVMEDMYDEYSDENNEDFFIPNFYDRESNRYKNIINSYFSRGFKKTRVNLFSKKMSSTKNIIYSLLYSENNKEFFKYVSPQCLHKVGKFFFNMDEYGNLMNSTINIKCEFKGEFRRKMRPIMNLLDCKSELTLDIRFSKELFSKTLVSNIWSVDKNIKLEEDEYYLHLYHSIDNELIFQLSSNKGYLVGELNPLKGKYEANFIKNFLQIREGKVNKLKKLVYY